MLLAAVSWDNGGDGSTWEDPLNWSGDVVPASGDDAVISSAWTWRGTISLAGQHQVRSVNAAVRLRVTGILLVDTASTINQLSLEGGTIGGVGNILVQQEQAATSIWTSGTFKGPGSITFNSPLEMRDGPAGSVRKIDGATLRGGGITLASGQLTVGDSTGTAPRIVAVGFPTNGTTGFTWNGTLGYINTGTRPLEVEAWTQVRLNPGSAGTRDLSSVKYWDLGGTLVIESGKIKIRDASFTAVSYASPSSVLEVSGTSVWSAVNASTTSLGTLRFVGGTHRFLWEGSTRPAKLEVTAGATLLSDAPQTLENILLDHGTLRTAHSLGANPMITSAGGTLDYTATEWLQQITVSAGDPTLVPNPFYVRRVDVSEDATLRLGPTSPGVGEPDFHNADTLWLARNATVVGPYARLNAGTKLTAAGANALVDTTFNHNGLVEVLAGASLTLRGDVMKARSGVLSGEWRTLGQLVLDGVPQVTKNTGLVTLSGAAASFPALNSVSLNNGEIHLVDGLAISLPNLSRNQALISLDDGAALTVADGFENAGTLLIQQAQLSVAGDLALTAQSQLAVLADPASSLVPLVIDGTATLGGSLYGYVFSTTQSASTSQLIIQAQAVLSQFAQSGAETRGKIRNGRAAYTPTQVLMDWFPVDPTQLALTAESDTGTSSTDKLTRDTTPTFSVRTNDAGTLRFYLDGQLMEERTVDVAAEITHPFTVQTPLTDGAHVFRAVMVDQQGNASTGGAAVDVTIDTVSPQFVSGVMDESNILRLWLQFNEPISPDGTSNVRFVDAATGNSFPAASLFNDQANSRLRVNYASTLYDANWNVTFANMTTATDRAGNPMTPWTWGFFVLAGDINRDRKVGFDDLMILAQNFGLTNRTFYQGNINHDSAGRVNMDDLLILAQKYGNQLAPPAPLTQLGAAKRTQHASFSVLEAL